MCKLSNVKAKQIINIHHKGNVSHYVYALSDEKNKFSLDNHNLLL